MDTIRVLHVIKEGSMGGGQRHILTILNQVENKMFSFGIVCGSKGYFYESVEAMNIPAFIVSMKYFPDVNIIRDLIKIIRIFRPDIIHTHGGIAGFWGRLAGIIYGEVKIVHTYHGIHYLHYPSFVRRKLFSYIDRILLHYTDLIICVSKSDEYRGELVGVVDSKKCLYIPNGIDIKSFTQQIDVPNEKHSIGIFPDSLVVGMIGRLHPEKGHRYFLDAASKIVSKYTNVEFVILGDGELSENLRDMAVQLGIASRTHFLGFRNNIVNYLHTMDIIVFPSLWEGHPFSLLEAMAAGKAIVASNIDSIREVLKDGMTGILVPPKDSTSIAQAIGALLDSKEERDRIGRQAQITVIEAFPSSKMINSLEQAYLNLVTAKNKVEEEI